MRFSPIPPSHSFLSYTTLSYLLRKSLLLRKLRKIFFVSLSRRISAHPFPSPIHFVRSLCWLIRGCRRNQDQMPSSPKVVMGGKFRKKLFPLKILQNSARIVQLARVCPTEIFFFHFLSTCFVIHLFPNQFKQILLFPFSKNHPRICWRSKLYWQCMYAPSYSSNNLSC